MNIHVLQEGSMKGDNQREVVEVMGDVEENGDLSLEAMKDEEVALIDGVFEGAFSALGDERWCVDSLEVKALVGAMEVMKVDDKLNFIEWYHNLRIVLSDEEKLPFLEQPIASMPIPPAGQVLPPDVLNTYIAWVKASKEIDSLMLMTMYPDIQRLSEHLGTYDMLKELKTLSLEKKLSRLSRRVDEKEEAISRSYHFRGSRKLKLGALSLYVADGHRATVEAIGEFHLYLPSGLVLILHNCHYAPSITRGIILVLRLYKDGFVKRFENDNSISVFRNNLIYFNAIPPDDIYEIVLSSPNTNDSSMYVVRNKRAKLNLDSVLLWQCRLGHISKKRIEKLQHDGLLDLTDIKSFEKCVSCMSGKMSRKPYSHQMEMAKDLLGLIHTDVCGPFKIILIDQEAIGSLKYLEIIQEEDIHLSIDTSLHHKEGDKEINEPQSDINTIHRSTRTRRPIDRLCLCVDAEEHELGDHGEPANYKAALLDHESNKWLNVMNVKMQSMRDNEV
uniref:GAG-pre-integrase domain-containing protein n=1 Tax=Tanacetum cinerariifolium TaxID=118510 RepID=A0A6L2L408_TANCI|nr:hypothetical protein [Tanacetum cinerariifolium]